MTMLQRLRALWAFITPAAMRLANDKRRLERACADAGVSRSVARRVSAAYFNSGGPK